MHIWHILILNENFERFAISFIYYWCKVLCLEWYWLEKKHQTFPLNYHREIISCWYQTTGVKRYFHYTVDSRSPRDSLEYFEISVPRHIRLAELSKTINRTTTFNKWICNLTPKLGDILKILGKRGEIAPEEQFLLFFTIIWYLLLDFHVITGTRFFTSR